MQTEIRPGVLDCFTAYGMAIPDSFSPQAMAQTMAQAMPTGLGLGDEEDSRPPSPKRRGGSGWLLT